MRCHNSPMQPRLSLLVFILGLAVLSCQCSTDPVVEAKERLAQGDNEAVLQLLEGNTGWEAYLIRGQALLGQTKYRLAMEELAAGGTVAATAGEATYNQQALDAFLAEFRDLLATKSIDNAEQSVKLLEHGGELAGQLEALDYFTQATEQAVSDAAEAYDNQLAQYFARTINRAETANIARRAMADLRSIGTAIESYSIDHNVYPVATNIEELAKLLEPVYIRTLPREDGWGRSFVVSCRRTEYTICSGGQDGGGCFLDGFGGPTIDPNQAIVFSNGQFVQWPGNL